MATLVSCYYNDKLCKESINKLLSNITCNTIIFTSNNLGSYIKSFKNIYIIIKEYENISKIELIKDAIEINPFNSDKFIWNDIDIIKDNKYIKILKYYPDINKISDDKIDIMLLNNNEPCLFGSNKTTLLKYYNEFNEFNKFNKFKQNPEIFNIIQSIKYYTNVKFVIFKESGRLGNAIFRYFASSLLCIKNNYKYILHEDYVNEDDYIYYKNLDYIGSDISFNPTLSLNNLFELCNNNNNAICFNTLGFIKSDFNEKILISNNYIKSNNNGLYVKNIININDNNYYKYYNKLNFNNVLMDDFFHFEYIYLKYKDDILEYIEQNKNEHYIKLDNGLKILMKDVIDDIVLLPNKIYDIVIHIRLGDFNGRIDYIEYEYLEKLLNNINFINKNIAIIMKNPDNENDIKYLKRCIEWFKDKNININIETNNTVITDFNIMKQCKVLICSMSTLSWSAAYLSKNIELCYMPNYNFYNIRNTDYFKKPIQNTILYDVKSTKFSKIKIVILTLKEYPDRLKYIDKLIINLAKLGINYEIVYGINGKNIKIYNTEHNHIKLLYNNFETYYYDITKRLNKTLMGNGILGCTWSHLNIYNKIINDKNYDKYLIFEDDAHLYASLDEVYNTLNNLPEDFDLCHIGESDYYPFLQKKKINEYFYTIHKRFFNRLTSYIVSKKGALKIINYVNNFINIPADDIIYNISTYTKDFNLYVPKKYLFNVPKNIESISNNINKK